MKLQQFSDSFHEKFEIDLFAYPRKYTHLYYKMIVYIIILKVLDK